MTRPQALIFDVDGTLYGQRPLRAWMARQFAAYALQHPIGGLRASRLLRAYRKAQDQLRVAEPADDLAAAQLEWACRRTGAERTSARAIVELWMEQRPLEALRACVSRGVPELLDRVRRAGMRIAAVSDYPAEHKLEAMNLREYFDVVVSAQDRRVQRFKPDPRGLLVALGDLRVASAQAVYIGDRPEVDAEAAERAGVRCFIVGQRRRSRGCTWMAVKDMAQLSCALGLG